MEAHRVLKENNFNVSPTIIESDFFKNSSGFAVVISAAAQQAAVTADHSRCGACLQPHLSDVNFVFIDCHTGRAVLQAATTRSNSLPAASLQQLQQSPLLCSCPASPNFICNSMLVIYYYKEPCLSDEQLNTTNMAAVNT
jgi:hypothetical protein